jgi:hypothetical protein
VFTSGFLTAVFRTFCQPGCQPIFGLDPRLLAVRALRMAKGKEPAQPAKPDKPFPFDVRVALLGLGPFSLLGRRWTLPSSTPATPRCRGAAQVVMAAFFALIDARPAVWAELPDALRGRCEFFPLLGPLLVVEDRQARRPQEGSAGTARSGSANPRRISHSLSATGARCHWRRNKIRSEGSAS